MQATAGAGAVSWTRGLCCRGCAERVTIKGDPRWGKAVHAASGKEMCADGRLIAPIDADIVKAAASRAGGRVVIVWLWQAGSTQGVVVAGNQAKARSKVASCMRDTGAVTAVLEMAHFDGMKSLNGAYAPVDGQCWVARCHLSGRVSWRLRAPAREPAAA